MARPQLEVSLYGEPVLRLDLATVKTPRRRVTVLSDRFRYCTAARLHDTMPSEEAVTRWLLGLRPESGARRAQDVRARERLRESQGFSQGYEGGQAEIVWALPGTEYAGAISFRSLDAGGETLEPNYTARNPLTARTLDRLLDRIKREMANDPKAARGRLDALTRAVETRCEEIRRELPQSTESDHGFAAT